MRDAETLRKMYNERFRGPSSGWTSLDLKKCKDIASRVSKWSFGREIKGLSLLDVGCALGYYTKAFQQLGFDAYGLDYSEVAIERAERLHPECHFLHADGFNPSPGRKFDLIFCKGFSGSNTHDLDFVAGWSNKYMDLLNDGGKFVFAFSTDYSGEEKGEETVNWTRDEIDSFRKRIKAGSSRVKHYYRYYLLSQIIAALISLLQKSKPKQYFYIIFSK